MLVILEDSSAQVNNHQEKESTFPTPGRQDLDSGDKSPCPRAGLSLWSPMMKSETRVMEDQSNSTSICLFQSNSLAKFLKETNLLVWTISLASGISNTPSVHKAAGHTPLGLRIHLPPQPRCNATSLMREAVVRQNDEPSE